MCFTCNYKLRLYVPSVTRLIEEPLHSDLGSNSIATIFTKAQKKEKEEKNAGIILNNINVINNK